MEVGDENTWFTECLLTFNSNFMSNTCNLIFPVDIYLMLLSGLAFQLYIMLNFSSLNSISIDKLLVNLTCGKARIQLRYSYSFLLGSFTTSMLFPLYVAKGSAASDEGSSDNSYLFTL